MNKKTLMAFVLSCTSFLLLHTSCDDDKEQGAAVNLSTTQVTAKIGEEFSVDITLNQADKFQTIVVEKTISGKKVEEYTKTLTVSDIQFPYTFKEEAIPADEAGVVVYSFYGMGANGQRVDASDVVLTLNVTQLYRLLKYDWKPASQFIQQEDYAKADIKDDVYRFHEDFSWEMDWGTTFSDMKLETLDSFCAWKMIGTDERIDSIFMIKYGIFSATTPVVIKYRVASFIDNKLVLESRQDLSFLGFDTDEIVLDTYVGSSKTSDFIPYRGSDPNSYIIEACNPGSY